MGQAGKERYRAGKGVRESEGGVNLKLVCMVLHLLLDVCDRNPWSNPGLQK